MSMGRRIWRIARRSLQEGLEKVERAAGGWRDPAREELEEFLKSPSPPAPPGASRAPDPPRASPPEPPPPHPYAYEYRLLGAPVGSDLETVQRCWRVLVRETHPDRFAGNPEAQARAAERLLRVNQAYERLRGYLENGE